MTPGAVQLLWENWSTVCDVAGVGRLQDGKPEGCYLDDQYRVVPGPTLHLGLLLPGSLPVVVTEGCWLVRVNDQVTVIPG
jgi:hypothetical protein